MDWKATIEEILAERREHMGERPPLEDIVAFRAGDLSETDGQLLLERASVDPEVARELFDIVLFPDLPTSDNKDESAQELGPDLRWQAFREHIRQEEGRADASIPWRRADPSPMVPSWDIRSWFPIAASFVIGIGLTLAVMKAIVPTGVNSSAKDEGKAPVQVNLPIVELLPVGETATRSRQRVRIPAEADGIVVTLAASGISMGHQPTYGLELRDQAGQLIDSLEGLKAGPGGVFVVTLPRALLVDGLVEMHLTDNDHAAVDSYGLDLLLE